MVDHSVPTLDNIERHVLDAEAASAAILEAPRLRPASLANLERLSGLIVSRLDWLEATGEGGGQEATNLRDLKSRVEAVSRRLAE